jgi:hypothetical protein
MCRERDESNARVRVLLFSLEKRDQLERIFFSIGEMALKALLRAKLSVRKTVTNQTEAATTGRAAHPDLRDIGFCTIFTHHQAFLIRTLDNMRRRLSAREI